MFLYLSGFAVNINTVAFPDQNEESDYEFGYFKSQMRKALKGNE